MRGQIEKIREDDLLKMLAAKYSGKEWVVLPHLRNGTGFQRSPRTADALVMSVYPSRGLTLHGFEVKVSRSDWLRELKDPDKAESMARFCETWHVVAPAETVIVGEMPMGWGLLCPKDGKLKEVKPAVRIAEPTPIDRLLLASIFRNVADTYVSKASIADQLRAAREAGRADEKDAAAVRPSQANRELAELRKTVAEFESASGVDIRRSWRLGDVGKAVRHVSDAMQTKKHLETNGDHLCGAVNVVRSLLRELEGVAEEMAKVKIAEPTEDAR